MIGPGAGTRIYLACGGTDMRRGFDGLSAQVQKSLSLDPFNGAVFVFRGKRGDRVKLLSLSWFASKPLSGNGVGMDKAFVCFTSAWRKAGLSGLRHKLGPLI